MTNPHPIRYRFVPPGSVAEPAPGELWLDTGNRLGPGVIDHHQPDAPERCTSGLVLDRPELVLGSLGDLPNPAPLTLVTHQGPDMDAVTATVLVERTLSDTLTAGAARLADYVCAIDRGETRLDPARPITPYSVFLACLHLARSAAGDKTDAADLAAMEAGAELVRWLIGRLDEGLGLDALSRELEHDPAWAAERALILADRQRYQGDLGRAKRLHLALPRVAGGTEPVPGLWIERPEALLFKSWARGDRAAAADPRRFVFLAVVLSPERTILSVQPDRGVWLKGLGAALERAETAKRRSLGQERQGAPRPGYDSPDPWYDGRSPLHGWTIIDAPRAGSLLSPAEIRAVLDDWLDQGRER